MRKTGKDDFTTEDTEKAEERDCVLDTILKAVIDCWLLFRDQIKEAYNMTATIPTTIAVRLSGQQD